MIKISERDNIAKDKECCSNCNHLKDSIKRCPDGSIVYFPECIYNMENYFEVGLYDICDKFEFDIAIAYEKSHRERIGKIKNSMGYRVNKK